MLRIRRSRAATRSKGAKRRRPPKRSSPTPIVSSDLRPPNRSPPEPDPIPLKPILHPRRSLLRRLVPALCAFVLVAVSVAQAQNPNLLMGNPSDASDSGAEPDNYLKDYTHFVLSYNSTKGTPNWVSWRLVASDIGPAKRSNPFHADNDLPDGFKVVVPADYSGTGFDRGHMCNFKDRSSAPEVFRTTFVMTNMVPQSPRLNEDTWERLEEYCRTLARHNEHLYIIAGPLGAGGEGLIKPSTLTHASAIGGPDKDRVVVPAYCWKVILVVDDSDGDDLRKVNADTRLIAVIMPNNQELSLDWTTFRVSVREVEARTGYTFFTAVPASIIGPLKDKVDDVAVTQGK